MRDFLAAGRYAEAFFQLVKSEGLDAEAEAELESLSAALKAVPELERFLLNPRFTAEEKEEKLAKLYKRKGPGVHGSLISFLMLLLKKNRFHLIHEIASNFKRIADESQGEVTVRIETASPLDSKREAELVSQLERLAGLKITVRREVKPELIGGVVIRMRNKIIDGSVKNGIERFKKELTKIRTV